MAFPKRFTKSRRFRRIIGHVIALHSPAGVAETGLCVCPPEKNARKLAHGVRRDTFSGAV